MALAFLTIGIDRIDEDAREAYVFRPLLIPGILVIWRLVLWRWDLYETGTGPWPTRYDPPRKSDLAVGLILPIGIVVNIGTGLLVRQTWLADFEPMLTSPPALVPE